LEETRLVERDLDTRGFVSAPSERTAQWDQNAFPYSYWKTTLAPPDAVANFFTGPEHYVDGLAMVRMRLIELALLDFKREHHKLPDSLHDLVPAYFDKLPIDPWGGREFVYEPKGLLRALHFKNCLLDPGTPFLASAGMSESQLVRQPEGAYHIVSRTPDIRYSGSPTWFPGMAIELGSPVPPVATPKGAAKEMRCERHSN
jgi:hypothetical protein